MITLKDIPSVLSHYPERDLKRVGICIFFLFLAACAGERIVVVDQPNPSIGPEEADKLFVVDCLLPGQIRKLGQQMTFLTQRRPVRTTAGECEIRGGEYVAYDRANYATALKVWLPQAKQGDPEAQTYVGEIYEKGLGLQADHRTAAAWYQKAAEQGYTAAQINLGYLYEKGLGVQQDIVASLNWYRKASGLEGTDIAFAASVEITNAQMEQLRQDASRAQRETESLRRELDVTKTQLENTRRELRRRKNDIERSRKDLDALRRERDEKRYTSGKDSDPELKNLENRLKQRERELAGKQNIIAQLEESAQKQRQTLEQLKQGAIRFADESAEQIKRLKSELTSRHKEAASLRETLSKTQTQLISATSELEKQNKEIETERKSIKLQEKALAKKKMEAITAKQTTEVAELTKRLAQREEELLRKQEKVNSMGLKMQKIVSQNKERMEQLDRQKKKIADLQESIEHEQREKALAQGASQKLAAIVGPSIEIIEPPLTISRDGVPSVRTRSGLTNRMIIGKVVAPGGLLSFSVNEVEETVDGAGMFKVEVPIKSHKTPVNVVAVDRNSRRAEIAFDLIQPASKAKVDDRHAVQLKKDDAVPHNLLPRSLFGDYHALIIGNNKYNELPQLDTAIQDAEVIGSVLKKHYGFKTKILLNANRYQMMKALNEYRKNLTEKDNLLIYYAGHGILDKVNDRGHWLPVDAEKDSNANWISIQNVTDLLKIMASRHILVVSDSCYSGALTRNAVARLDAGMTPEKRAEWVKLMLKAKSREAFSSGGLEPVMDGGGGGHSVFAKALVDTLKKNREIMEGQRLYREVSALVADAANSEDFDQVPEYAPIRRAGHAAGQFFFVPTAIN